MFKGRHFDQSVILLCVRWYLAYNLSLRNLEEIMAERQSRRDLKPIRIRQSAYLNNRIEQDHRAIKKRVRPRLGLQSVVIARVILGGIEMIHITR